MSLDALQELLPPGNQVPSGLLKLFDYAKPNGGLVLCDFSVTQYLGDDVVEWFQGDESVAKQFVMFGKDRTSSMYGWWFHEGVKSIAEAPLVFLGGEGSYNTVLANTLEELLQLLAIGKYNVGMVRRWDKQDKQCDNLAEYVAFLKNDLNLSPPADGRAIVDRAKQAHPDLDQFVEKFLEQRSGK